MRSVALFTALLLVLSGAGPAVAAPDSAAASGTDGAAALRSSADGAVRAQTSSSLDQSPETVMRVALRADQSAKWRVEVRYQLNDENETRAFEKIGREYERGESDVGVDADLFRNIAAQASDTTGREMEIRNATYDYSVNDGTGTLSMSFVWTNFLKEGEGRSLRLGDVFLVPSDQSESTPTWLSLMGENQRMIIHPPEGYTTNTTSIPVKQQSNAIILEGPSDFNDDERLVVTYRQTARERFEWPLYLGGGAVVLVALAVGAAVVLRSRRDGGADAPANATDGSRPGGATAATNGGTPAGGAVPAGDSDENGDAVAGPIDPGPGDGGNADEDEVDVSLLSDEERVEYLLEQNGGRMKQANIVKETGWSDAKVSQLLSAMADDGRVTKLRLGRENLISLPDGDGTEDGTA
ncbi:helix-turn-helix transcriptional regulator [Halopelagius fulvigenes]|uniref:Helix-turn-helix transcriptional regulator n=1 Tax=Halopelagius fulvigenes TaxID=1198324 RepID=A0ABD5U1Z7_9EURY